MYEHLGQTVENLDPRVAALENTVVRSLRKHGPSRHRDLWIRCTGSRFGMEFFRQVVDGLVERRVITRESTNRVNSFIYRMAPDCRRRQRAMAREENAVQQ